MVISLHQLNHPRVVHNTNPEKKKLIHPMMTVWGINMTILLFIMFIMLSIPDGSVRGFGGGAPRFSGSLRYSPFSNAACINRFRFSNAERGIWCAFARKSWARCNARLRQLVLPGKRLFANGFEGFWFWRGLEEEGCVVTEDSHHDHDYEYGDEDPVS